MLYGFLSLYSIKYPRVLLRAWYSHDRKISRYLTWFWTSRVYDLASLPKAGVPQRSLIVLQIGILLQIVAGLFVVYLGLFKLVVGGFAFGLAILLIYPVLWAHLLVVPRLIGLVFIGLKNPKKIGRAIICRILERQVRQLRAKNEFKIVAVVGSVGKTSTKLAIANVLSISKKVRFQQGNYNDRVTVPLIFFNQELPNLLNVAAWLKVFAANRKIVEKPYPFEVVVVELGTDGPGQLQDFAYLKPDLVVVTAVEAEHMEYFGTLEAVAKEELSVFEYAQQVIVNTDNVDQKFLHDKKFLSYGLQGTADFHAKITKDAATSLTLQGEKFGVKIPLLGTQGTIVALASASVASLLDMDQNNIIRGIGALEPFAGRMRVLEGQKGSMLIDDSYNASPVAVKAGLDVLYSLPSKNRIAILGNMNELGDSSKAAHIDVGEHCDPKKLSLVVTIGHDANQYLAKVAEDRGITVARFSSPYKAGEYVKEAITPDAVVLIEGSQNRVFAEEATKKLLANKSDEKKLVRQSNYWMKIKHSQFGSSS